MPATTYSNPVTVSRLEPGLAKCRADLMEARAALETAYRSRVDPGALLKRQASLVDRIVQTVWREAAMPSALALLAVGGYYAARAALGRVLR